MLKTCSRCKIEKPLLDFGKRNQSKSGFRSICKLCRKQDRLNNLEKHKEIDKKSRDKNKIERCERSKKYYQQNKEKKKEYDRKRYLETRGKNRTRKEEWLQQRSQRAQVKKVAEEKRKEEKQQKQRWILSQVQELSDKGIGSRKISEQLGINRSTVIKYYRQLGIDSLSKKKLKTVPFQTEKKCKECQEIKPVSEFRKRISEHRFGYEPYCFICEYKRNMKRLKEKYRWKMKNDTNYKLRKNVSYAIWEALKKNKSSKQNENFLEHLPYTIKELKEHLESQFEPWMNWNNWGVYNAQAWDDEDQATWTWQIDHIIPQSMLKYSSMQDGNFVKCWALNNLRPLSAKKNNLDGVKRIRHNNE